MIIGRKIDIILVIYLFNTLTARSGVMESEKLGNDTYNEIIDLKDLVDDVTIFINEGR